MYRLTIKNPKQETADCTVKKPPSSHSFLVTTKTSKPIKKVKIPSRNPCAAMAKLTQYQLLPRVFASFRTGSNWYSPLVRRGLKKKPTTTAPIKIPSEIA